jgi:hypothetical protein
MRLPVSLVYSGRTGQLFIGIKSGHSLESSCIHIYLDSDNANILVPYASLNGRVDLPPFYVWPEVFTFLWPGAKQDNLNFNVPLGQFAESFAKDPDAFTAEALGPIFVCLLERCLDRCDGADWRHLLKSDGCAIDPETLKARLGDLIKQRIKRSDRRKGKKRVARRTRVGRLDYLFPSYVFCVLIAAHWDFLKQSKPLSARIISWH